MKLSIIIPVLNEAKQIACCLKKLQALRVDGHEVLVVDGGSGDETWQIAAPFCDKIIHADLARARQMNIGAAAATGDYLLFLHADTFLPDELHALFNACVDKHLNWGRFDVRLSGKHILFRIIEKSMAVRSRLTGIATGDQAIFVHKTLFDQIGGYPEIALMEDIAISQLLNKITRPICLNLKVQTSSRRWERHGIIKTIIKMWLLRLLYFCNYDPNKLATMYQSHG